MAVLASVPAMSSRSRGARSSPTGRSGKSTAMHSPRVTTSVFMSEPSYLDGGRAAMPPSREVAMRQKKPALALLAAVLSAAVGLIGALALKDRVRLVDIIQLFAGGAGAGAGIAAAIAVARGSRANVYPALKYQNGAAAMEWLLRTFGFSKRVESSEPDGSLAHAELSLGRGMIMLGSVGKPDTSN